MLPPTLKQEYHHKIAPELKKKLGYTSIMQVPRLLKIVINQGLGSAITNPKILEKGLEELTLIAGQKAVPTKAKKSISNFKLRAGMSIGAKVTLRGNYMYEFLYRLINIILPREREFKGISPTAFDQQGNYNLGIKEQIIFLEINIDKISKITGLNITFVTSCKDKKTSYLLLKALGLPFSNIHKS